MNLDQMDPTLKQDKSCIHHALQSLNYSPTNVISVYLVALIHLQQERIELAQDYYLKIGKSADGLSADKEELDVVIGDRGQIIKGNEPQL